MTPTSAQKEASRLLTKVSSLQVVDSKRIFLGPNRKKNEFSEIEEETKLHHRESEINKEDSFLIVSENTKYITN